MKVYNICFILLIPQAASLSAKMREHSGNVLSQLPAQFCKTASWVWLICVAYGSIEREGEQPYFSTISVRPDENHSFLKP